MMRLSEKQKYARIATEPKFVAWYVDDFMPSQLPEVLRLFKRDKLVEMVAVGRRIAVDHGFTDPPSQAHFITLMWKIGAGFFTMPGFREIALDRTRPGPERINRFYAVSEDQAADAILAADDAVWFSYRPSKTREVL